MSIITEKDALLLLINTYMIKKIDDASKEVDQEKFIEYVQEIFHQNNFSYSRKQILTTWKHLLESYYHFKENLSSKQATEAWWIFPVMDNCFDESISTSEKFSNPNFTIYLIKYMSEYKEIILNHGLTMTVLRDLENKFQNLKNNSINQKDIYVQWNNLRKCYDDKHEIHSQNIYKFIEAMKFYIYNTDSQNHNSGGISKRPSIKNQGFRKTKDIQNEVNDIHTVSLEMRATSSARIRNAEQISTRKDVFEVNLNSTRELFVGNGDDSSKHTCENSTNINLCKLLRSKVNGHHSTMREEIKTVTKADRGVNEILNKYENRYKELAELKEVVIENNLLRKEYKYLLSLFSDKMKSKRLISSNKS